MATQDVLKCIADLKLMILDVIAIVKSQEKISVTVPAAFDILKGVIALAKDLKVALPELKSLSADDYSAILEAVYECVQAIVSAL